MVGKRGPVVSSRGEATTPFTQNASWWLSGTLRPLRKDTADSQDSWGCNPTSQVCLGPSSWQQLDSMGPSAEHSPVPWPAASPQRQPVWPYPPVGACLPPPHPQNCKPKAQSSQCFFDLGQNLETLTLMYIRLVVIEEIYSFGGNREFAPLKT